MLYDVRLVFLTWFPVEDHLGGCVCIWTCAETGWIMELRYTQWRRREIPEVLHQWKNRCMLPVEIILIPPPVFIYSLGYISESNLQKVASVTLIIYVLCVSYYFNYTSMKKGCSSDFCVFLWHKHQLNVCHCFLMKFFFPAFL